MGDRAQVLIEDEGVYLYTHWTATELPNIVKTALRKRWRWDDPEYLARIIFCEMVKSDLMDETGYGIGSNQHQDIWRLIKINCKENKIIQEEFINEEFKTNKEKVFEGTFEEYINDTISSRKN